MLISLITSSLRKQKHLFSGVKDVVSDDCYSKESCTNGETKPKSSVFSIFVGYALAPLLLTWGIKVRSLTYQQKIYLISHNMKVLYSAWHNCKVQNLCLSTCFGILHAKVECCTKNNLVFHFPSIFIMDHYLFFHEIFLLPLGRVDISDFS